ncbi:hypothetical protein EJ02DRAFT_205347, partial [Clathrospora elynae]
MNMYMSPLKPILLILLCKERLLSSYAPEVSLLLKGLNKCPLAGLESLKLSYLEVAEPSVIA